MGLLDALQLPPSRAMKRQAQDEAAQARKDAPAPVAALPEGASALKTPRIGAPLKAAPRKDDDEPARTAGGAPADDPARAAALAMRGRLVEREAKLREAYQTVAASSRKLADEIRKAERQGLASKPTLVARKKQFDDAADDLGRRVDAARRDVEAVDDPTTPRDALAKILAQAGSVAELPAELQKQLKPGGDKRTEAVDATVKSGLKDGEAVVETTENKLRVGLDGITSEDSETRQVVDAGGSVKTGKKVTETLGPGGYDREVAQTVEFEADVDGKTQSWGSERKESLHVGADGVVSGTSVKVTQADGSSQEVARQKGFVRGDGKAGVTESVQREKVDADGNVQKETQGATAGVIADGKGVGGFGDANVGGSTQRKNGLVTNADLKVHASVKCEVGDPVGNPPLYPVSIAVDCGAEFSFGAGRDKKGGSVKAGLSLTLGANYVFRQTHHLSEDKLEAYAIALKAAASGGAVEKTYREMAVIQTGVTQGWQAAQQVAKGKGPLSPEMIATLQQAGDSVEIATDTTIGGKGSVDAKFVQAEYGRERKEAGSVKATRDEQGRLNVEAQRSQQDKTTRKVGVSLDGVGVSFGDSHTVRTAFGFDITVDPVLDPDGKILAALAACKEKADYRRLLEKHPDALTLNGTLESDAEAQTDEVGLSVLGAEASIGTGHGSTKQVKKDGRGKVVNVTLVGEQHAGGGVKVGDKTYGDSGENRAVGQIDEEGQTSLDLSRTKHATDGGKVADAVKKKLGIGKDEKESKGLLQTVAGGGDDEPDVQVHNVFGIRLNHEDLKAIGKLAMNHASWTPKMGNKKDIDAWRAAGGRIAKSGGDPKVVVAELTGYVGSSSSNRLEHLRLFLRPGGDVSIGTEYSFPDALARHAKDYEALVVADAQKNVSAALKKWGPGKAAEVGSGLLSRLRALQSVIAGSTAFGDKTAQAAMVGAIVRRITAIEALVRQIEGKDDAAAERAAAQKTFDHACESCEAAQKSFDAQLAELARKVPPGKRLVQGDKNPLYPAVNKLLDVRAMLRRELKAARELAERHRLDAKRLATLGPDDKEVERIKDAMGMYHSAE